METNPLHVEFFHLMHRFKRLNLAPVFGNLLRSEFFTLETLRQDSLQNPGAAGMYVSSLAVRLQMSPPAVSRLLRALEAKGLIERMVDPADRRNTFIRLTEQGLAIQLRARAQMHRFLGCVVEEMGEQNMQTLLVLWNGLIDSMEKVMHSLGEGEGECSKSSNT